MYTMQQIHAVVIVIPKFQPSFPLRLVPRRRLAVLLSRLGMCCQHTFKLLCNPFKSAIEASFERLERLHYLCPFLSPLLAPKLCRPPRFGRVARRGWGSLDLELQRPVFPPVTR
ncbi:hypothetical protein L202_07510, partial [Cryptococcus amylolentus CBS 6039]